MKKKLFVLLLTLFAVTAVGVSLPENSMTVQAAQQQKTQAGIFDYKILKDGTVEITDYSEVTGVTEVVIPAEIDGKRITSIGYRAFEGCSSLSIINIPDSVTSIGMSAFNGCHSLCSINIPDSVTSIGYCAFFGCSSLNNITIPDSVTSIGMDAFVGTVWLEKEREKNSLVIVNGILIDAKTATGDVSIPDTVASIGDGAFYGCSSLSSINIPDRVTYIGQYAFYGCSSLSSINIPDRVTYIGGGAFSRCSRLSNINIPNTVTSIEYEVFNGCSSLCSINIPDRVTSIGDDTFRGCKSLSSITIPDNLTFIGIKAFYGCSSLKDVYYSGTKKQWKKIAISTGNNALKKAKLHDNAPKGTSIFTINAKQKAIDVKWNKQTKKVTGYQIQYSTNKNFKGAKTLTIKTNKKTSTTVKKLNANKKYYVRIRTYKTVKSNGKSNKLYSDWSNAENVTTKK